MGFKMSQPQNPSYFGTNPLLTLLPNKSSNPYFTLGILILLLFDSFFVCLLVWFSIKTVN